MTDKISFIVNPNAAMGAVGKEWGRIKSIAEDRLGSFDAVFSKGPGDLTRITREAIEKGADLIICVGGDGTLNEVTNGFMNEKGPARPDSVLGVIPRGTGCDFSKTVSLNKELEKAFDIIIDRNVRTVDLGRLGYKNFNGDTESRYFLNVTSFGLGGEVAQRVNRNTRLFGGFISFIWSTLISLLIFNKKLIRLRVDDIFDEELIAWNVVIANGQYHGGGMWVAPEAVIDDGLFDVTILGDFSLPEIVQNLAKLYNGKILGLEKVRSLRGKKIKASSGQKVLLETDGEQPGELPVTVEMVPGALRIIAPPF